MIELRDIRFRYPGGDFRLEFEELEVAAGEALAVVGASGSGKSTLLSLMAGIRLPAHGTVRVGDVEVSALDDAARRRFRLHELGLVFQELELLDHLDVRDNVLLPARLSTELRVTADLRQRGAELVAGVGLDDKWRRNVRSLSQGERQRIALARGLLLRPPVLLCDEPTGSLDPNTTEAVAGLILDRARESGATLVVVTHDHDLLPRFDRVLDMRDLFGGRPA